MAATRRLSSSLISGFLWWSQPSLIQSFKLCPTVVQTRQKQLKTGRYKAPHEPKVQEKWTKSAKNKIVSGGKSQVIKSAAFMSRVPVDDVWIRSNYPRLQLPLEECIVRHQESADPSMGDNMDGFLYADMELDMRTSKKTKFLSGVKGTILLPHLFEQPTINQKIAIFCKKEEDLKLAKSLGADYVGCEDLVKEILDGVVDREDLDVIICTADAIADLIPIRATLRDKFPSKARGNVGTDVEQMWKLYTQGITYASQKQSDAISRMQVPVGQIKMSTAELMENFMAYINTMCKGRAKNLGPLITEVAFVAPPSFERFFLKVEKYVPGFDKKTQPSKQAEEEEDSDEEEEAQRQ